MIDNNATKGGGIFVDNSIVEITFSNLLKNDALIGTAVHANTGTVVLINNILLFLIFFK